MPTSTQKEPTGIFSLSIKRLSEEIIAQELRLQDVLLALKEAGRSPWKPFPLEPPTGTFSAVLPDEMRRLESVGLRVEAKWTNVRTDAAALRSFQEKVGDGFEGTRGLFVSYSGFTDEGLHAFNAKRVILMNGMDVFQTLRRRISLDEIIAAKFRRGTEERRSLIEVSELFPQ